MIPTISVDARQAYARFSESGIPENVRKSLRQMLPQLVRRVGAALDRRLDSELKSRTNLAVRRELVEDPKRVAGRIRLEWTGVSTKAMVPQWLEEGTSPHEIAAVRARALYFFWDRIGAYAMFKKVMHPGTRPYRLAENTLVEMEPDIVATLTEAVREAVAR